MYARIARKGIFRLRYHFHPAVILIEMIIFIQTSKIISIFLLISNVFGCIPTESPIDDILTTTTTVATTTSTETPTTTPTATSTSTSTTTTTTTTSTTTTTTTTTPAPLCPPDWTYFTMTDSCYLLASGVGLNYNGATNYCVMRMANLASVHSPEENAFIAGLAPEEDELIALGIRRIIPCPPAPQPCFQNQDGTPFDYTNWSGGQPDNQSGGTENCVNMLLSFHMFPCCPMPPNGFRGQWNDIPCTTTFKYLVCKMPRLP